VQSKAAKAAQSFVKSDGIALDRLYPQSCTAVLQASTTPFGFHCKAAGQALKSHVDGEKAPQAYPELPPVHPGDPHWEYGSVVGFTQTPSIAPSTFC
jgi:hypothetical protein